MTEKSYKPVPFLLITSKGPKVYESIVFVSYEQTEGRYARYSHNRAKMQTIFADTAREVFGQQWIDGLPIVDATEDDWPDDAVNSYFRALNPPKAKAETKAKAKAESKAETNPKAQWATLRKRLPTSVGNAIHTEAKAIASAEGVHPSSHDFAKLCLELASEQSTDPEVPEVPTGIDRDLAAKLVKLYKNNELTLAAIDDIHGRNVVRAVLSALD